MQFAPQKQKALFGGPNEWLQKSILAMPSRFCKAYLRGKMPWLAHYFHNDAR
jgi:hypothetical protein